MSWFHGKVKIAVSHHALNETRDELRVDKNLVFVLEPPKEPQTGRKNKKKEAGVTINNFGNGLSINKFKACTKFKTAFRRRRHSCRDFMSLTPQPQHMFFEEIEYCERMRLESANAEGLKKISPIRPTACLDGILDLGEAIVRLM